MPNLIIVVYPKKGTFLWAAVSEAWFIAAKTGAVIQFEFNEQTFKIDTSMDFDKLMHGLENRDEVKK